MKANWLEPGEQAKLAYKGWCKYFRTINPGYDGTEADLEKRWNSLTQQLRDGWNEAAFVIVDAFTDGPTS